MDACFFTCVQFSVFTAIGWEEHLRNDLFCVELDVNLKSINQSITKKQRNAVNNSAFTYRILTVAQTQTNSKRPKNTEVLAAQTRHKLLDQLHSSGIQPTS